MCASRPASSRQFYKNSKRPLKSWAFVSFDRFFEEEAKIRFSNYLCRVLVSHGVEVVNRNPPFIGPMDPRDPELPNPILHGLQLGAREAFRSGGDRGSPQLICVVLPGR